MNRRMAVAAVAGLAFAAGAAHAGSLTTETPSNNGSGGVWMDLTDLTPAGEFLSVNQIDIAGFTGTVGADVDVEIWTRSGTYVGFDMDPAGWTLTQTLSVTRLGTSENHEVPLDVAIEVPDGGTTAVYLQALESGGIRYFGTGANPPQGTYSNNDLELFSELATTSAEAFTGSRFSPRAFSGTVHYDVIPAPASLALLGLGGLIGLRRRR